MANAKCKPLQQIISEVSNGKRVKVAPNTYADKLEDGDIVITLHGNPIMRILAGHGNTEFVLSSCGWRTSTTKARIHDLLPTGISITQRKGEWYIQQRFAGRVDHEAAFYDGIRIGVINSAFIVRPKFA